MTIQASTLRPGLLVSLSTSVRGNVKYVSKDLENKTLKGGALKAKWETERTINDPAEYERAIQCRSKVRSYITGVCSNSAFGLLCPESAAEDLEKAIADARRAASDFNKSAKLTKIGVFVITGRIAQDDMEAVRAINSELSELLTDMESGIEGGDAKQIRESAGKAKEIAEMLNKEARIQAELAIEAGRRAATAIAKSVRKKGAVEVDRKALREIKEAKIVFLDLEEVADVAAPKSKGRQLELA